MVRHIIEILQILTYFLASIADYKYGSDINWENSCLWHYELDICTYMYTHVFIYIYIYIYAHTYDKMSSIWPGYQISNVRKTHWLD